MRFSLEGTTLDFRFIVHLAFEVEEGSDVLEITIDSLYRLTLAVL